MGGDMSGMVAGGGGGMGYGGGYGYGNGGMMDDGGKERKLLSRSHCQEWGQLADLASDWFFTLAV